VGVLIPLAAAFLVWAITLGWFLFFEAGLEIANEKDQEVLAIKAELEALQSRLDGAVGQAEEEAKRDAVCAALGNLERRLVTIADLCCPGLTNNHVSAFIEEAAKLCERARAAVADYPAFSQSFAWDERHFHEVGRDPLRVGIYIRGFATEACRAIATIQRRRDRGA
jgi:hypothetical protein